MDNELILVLEKIFNQQIETKVSLERLHTTLQNHLEQNKKTENSISLINEELVNYNLQLELHMKRSDQLEEQTVMLKKDSIRFNEHLIKSEHTKALLLKIIAVTVSLGTISGAILTILKYFT